jgi:hypothetical protein
MEGKPLILKIKGAGGPNPATGGKQCYLISLKIKV